MSSIDLFRSSDTMLYNMVSYENSLRAAPSYKEQENNLIFKHMKTRDVYNRDQPVNARQPSKRVFL
jgi:hypothetical protein